MRRRGFEILESRTMPACAYTGDDQSMWIGAFRALLIVARKKPTAAYVA